MTYAAFKGYVADVLARLVKVCIQHRMAVDYAARVVKWAHTQTTLIWESFEQGEPIQDVAVALFNLSAKGAREAVSQ